MKSITIVNHWGLLTRWRSSLSLFILEAIRNIRLWNVLMADKLVAQYGREEIRVITDVSPPDERGATLWWISSNRDAGPAKCLDGSLCSAM